MPEMHRFYPICPLFSPVKNGPQLILASIMKATQRNHLLCWYWFLVICQKQLAHPPSKCAPESYISISRDHFQAFNFSTWLFGIIEDDFIEVIFNYCRLAKSCCSLGQANDYSQWMTQTRIATLTNFFWRVYRIDNVPEPDINSLGKNIVLYF